MQDLHGGLEQERPRRVPGEDADDVQGDALRGPSEEEDELDSGKSRRGQSELYFFAMSTGATHLVDLEHAGN